MIAKIIIKRSFVDDKTPQIVALLNELRARAINQRGYISGETLIKSGAPNYMVVIASWQSPEDWHTWRDSDERNKFEAMLGAYQQGPTEYEELLLGTPLSVPQASPNADA
jgi:heme-degrading monooxygenase HmoA